MAPNNVSNVAEKPPEEARSSRRDFLVRAGALGAVVYAGGFPPAAYGARKRAPKLESEVNIIAWAQEWEFAKKPFEKATGVKVNMSFQTDPLVSATKIKARPGEFDIVSFGPFDTPFVSAGLVQELDPARLKHWKDLPTSLRQRLRHGFRGKVYMVPYYWGGTPMARQTQVIPTSVEHSWAVMWDPAYKGNVALIDQSAEDYSIMALYNHLDISDYSPEALKKNREAALKLLPNLRTFWSTGTDIQQLLARGDVGLTDVWDGTARALIKQRKPIEVIFPKEGIRGWIDGPGLVVKAPHPNAAYAWINYVTRPEIGAQLARAFSYTPANFRSFGLLDQATKDLLQASKVASLFDSGGFKLESLNVQQNKKISDWWQQTKIK